MITLTEKQIEIYGRPNFLCSGVAKLLISHGLYERGPNKAEYEQAVCIHWTSELLREHGENWSDVAQQILKNLGVSKQQVDEA